MHVRAPLPLLSGAHCICICMGYLTGRGMRVCVSLGLPGADVKEEPGGGGEGGLPQVADLDEKDEDLDEDQGQNQEEEQDQGQNQEEESKPAGGGEQEPEPEPEPDESRVPELIRSLGRSTVEFYERLLSHGRQELELSKLMIVGPGGCVRL